MAVASIFSIGWPFKQGAHKNPIFLIWLLFMAVCALLLFFKVEGWVYWLISMQVRTNVAISAQARRLSRRFPS